PAADEADVHFLGVGLEGAQVGPQAAGETDPDLRARVLGRIPAAVAFVHGAVVLVVFVQLRGHPRGIVLGHHADDVQHVGGVAEQHGRGPAVIADDGAQRADGALPQLVQGPAVVGPVAPGVVDGGHHAVPFHRVDDALG